ncbi:glycosyltransferase family 2 protein [Halomonas alimentaria]|uniref:glycosyltransferase family 2 protein n=1 Tax=Halomonas alimentaria TaxID=147248 RepID=UPI002492F529|nr:glycosyltransferase [Halomonas alimentaria]
MKVSAQHGVSVIIPTYCDWEGVDTCLAGLRELTGLAPCPEIFVVNNAPEDGPSAVIAWPDNSRLLNEPKPGSYAARNRGIAEARGEVLAFLDADCSPQPGWLESALACLETQGADLVAGHIQLTYRGSKLTPAECYEKAFAFRQAQNVEQGVAVTANLVVKREVFDSVGVFNEKMMSGGDFEFTRRATAAGFKLVYCPNAVVRHPARNTLSSLAQKAKRVLAGSMALHGETGTLHGSGRVLGNLGHDLLELLGRRDMTWRERGWALGVLVYLKGVKLRQRLAMRFGPRQARELPR